MEPSDLYGGISGCELELETYDLGEGVVLRSTYAHLMSPYLMAFAPPGPQGHHPAPWKAAKGGSGFDIHVEIHVPASFDPRNWLAREDTIWWIAALLRTLYVPFISVPVVSNMAFAAIPQSRTDPVLEPLETSDRLLCPGTPEKRTLRTTELEWIRDNWLKCGYLMQESPKLDTAFRAFDAAMIKGKASLSLIALWGGLEQLFSPSSGELRFRVSALIASYLEPVGPDRLALYRRILKLYDARSTAAHSASDVEHGPLIETYVVMRNVLMKMFCDKHVPDRNELEELLLGGDDGTGDGV
jgi:hypothetical protein